MQWFVYLLRCRDGSLYCGITNDLDRRMHAHECGKGSKYVFSHRPFKLVWTEKQNDKWCAATRERAIKKMSKKNKEKLVAPAAVGYIQNGGL